MLVHCGLTKSLGSSLQVGLVADECMVEEHWLRASSLLSLLKGPNVLVSILWEVVEALLARYHSDRPEESSIPTQGNSFKQSVVIINKSLFKEIQEVEGQFLLCQFN